MTIKLQYRDKQEYRMARDWYGSRRSGSRKNRKPKGDYDFKQCERNRRTQSKYEIVREVLNAG